MKDQIPYIEIHGPDERVNRVMASIVAHALHLVGVKSVGTDTLPGHGQQQLWDQLAETPVVIGIGCLAAPTNKAPATPHDYRKAWVPPPDVDWSAPLSVLIERYRVSKSTIAKYQQRHGVGPKVTGRPRGSFKIPPEADLNLPSAVLARLYRCTTETARNAKVRAAQEAQHGN